MADLSAQEIAQAEAFIAEARHAGGSLIDGPVSMLQVRFSLGYGRACALAERLEQLGVWRVFLDENDQRRAVVLRG
ncbi:MAG: hypothetical protein ACXW2U_02475 [Telluria sp.]